MMVMRVLTGILLTLVALLQVTTIPARPASGATASPAVFFDKLHGDTTQEEMEAMGRRSALVFSVRDKQIAAMRAINPATKLLMYELSTGATKTRKDYPYLNSQEAWWVHDGKGSRLHGTKALSNFWGLNMGQAGYRSYEQGVIASAVFANNYDGVYLDGSGPQWLAGREWQDVQDRPSAPTPDLLAGWPEWMVAFHREMHAQLGGRLHIFNSWIMAEKNYANFKNELEAILAAADGVQFDGFCHNREKPWDFANWRYQILTAQRIIGSGKVVLLKSPLDNMRQDPAKMRQFQRFCFGSYLLVADGKNAMFRAVDEADITYWNDRLYSAPLGAPLAPFYGVGSVYRRDFANGVVLVNGTGTTQTVELGRTYVRLSGAPRTSVQVEPLSADILLIQK